MTQYEPGAILNERPRPRVVVQFSEPMEQTLWVDALGSMFETVQPIVADRDVNWNEFDCVFTDRDPMYRSPVTGWHVRFPKHVNHFVVVSDGVNGMRDFVYNPERGAAQANPEARVRVRFGVVGAHVRKVAGLDDAVASAVDLDLAPVAKMAQRHTTFATNSPENFAFRPLLLGPDGAALAFSATLSSGASLWAVPDTFPILPLHLVRVAYREWSNADASRFPPLPDWEGEQSFLTAKELEISGRIAAEEARFAASTADHHEALAALHRELESANSEAEAGTRALLKADGDVLSAAVHEALQVLGFQCRDMDDELPESHREDLRVTDADAPGWEAIAEVKGYSKGAKVDIIQQANRHARAYAVAEGREPTVWMIVNAQRRQAPDTREVPFGSRADDVAAIAGGGDLVMDTRVLFELVRRVEANTVDSAAVRAWLRSQTGVVWQVPAEF